MLHSAILVLWLCVFGFFGFFFQLWDVFDVVNYCSLAGGPVFGFCRWSRCFIRTGSGEPSGQSNYSRFHQKAVYFWSLNAASDGAWGSSISGNGCTITEGYVCIAIILVPLPFWGSPELSSPALKSYTGYFQLWLHYKLISHILRSIGLPWYQPSGRAHDTDAVL